MKTTHLSLTVATGGTLTLDAGKDRDTVELTAAASGGKATKLVLHRLELHQLYKSCEQAWQHMDADPALTAGSDPATTGTAGQVLPSPDPVAS